MPLVACTEAYSKPHCTAKILSRGHPERSRAKSKDLFGVSGRSASMPAGRATSVGREKRPPPWCNTFPDGTVLLCTFRPHFDHQPTDANCRRLTCRCSHSTSRQRAGFGHTGDRIRLDRLRSRDLLRQGRHRLVLHTTRRRRGRSDPHRSDRPGTLQSHHPGASSQPAKGGNTRKALRRRSDQHTPDCPLCPVFYLTIFDANLDLAPAEGQEETVFSSVQ